jgi:tetraacyldisaccharide 4'-kinase
MGAGRLLLVPFSWLYALVMAARNWCYDRRILTIRKAGAAPVISVGNLTAGGTGKTPMVEYILRYYARGRHRVAVISRGYRRTSKGMKVVSDGRTLLEDLTRAGDEPYQIAKKFPEAIVLVGEDKHAAAREAISRFAPEVLVLDDGFQHRRLARDLDIVMVDGRTQLEGVRILPAGSRREPLSALSRADILAISSCGEADAAPHEAILRGLRRYSSAAVVSVRMKPARLRDLREGVAGDLAVLKGKKATALSGIGNPRSFLEILQELEVRVAGELRFRDHHLYTVSDLRDIERRCRQDGADLLVTTEKDALRLQACGAHKRPAFPACFWVEIEAVITSGAELLSSNLDRLITRGRQS